MSVHVNGNIFEFKTNNERKTNKKLVKIKFKFIIILIII